MLRALHNFNQLSVLKTVRLCGDAFCNYTIISTFSKMGQKLKNGPIVKKKQATLEISYLILARKIESYPNTKNVRDRF